MFKSILVPTDFSPAAEHALDLSIQVAAKFDANLLLAHAFFVPPVVYADGYVPIDALLTGAREALAEAGARASARYPRARTLWLEGDPRQQILAAIDRESIDLVAMGTHGRGALSRAFFGSVAERMVRTSPVPVLTTRQPAEPQDAPAGPPFRHVLVPTDFGEIAAHALTLASALASAFGAKLTVLHACPLLMPLRGDESVAWPASELGREAQRALDAALASVRPQCPRAEGVLLRGDARWCTLELAAARSADLVVIGTHGRRGLERFLLGSVAEGVVRGSPSSVLSVPGPRS